MNRGIARLRALRIDTAMAAEEMEGKRSRFSAIADSKPTVAVSSFNLFQTPEAIASRMAAKLGDVTGKKILEPSAGLGRLVRAVNGGCVTAVDISEECASVLREQFPESKVVKADFLTLSPSELGTFDAIIMNPPFKMGADVKHILHALEFLEDGGILVSLCYNGSKQNEKLPSLATTWEVLPEDSFKKEGTRASVVMLTIRK